MLIPEISEIGERSANASRWVAAARASRRSPAGRAPAPVGIKTSNGADEACWTARPPLALAAAQPACAAD
jgi:hypothetical protein